MYLKKLEMQGFKSFADKLSLDFGSGITTVVGPNGSGKSNISDAVRWVLGEQSAKSLRGGSMADVIFVGTESRRPVGFAEVSIIIDNSDGILPIAFQEVKVTRRLFRSGESEYLINMAPCRLKDIQQLFFDTGIGVDGYSIIGQGQVDSILSGKVEERRAIFEEASGIMKYKTRKVESERKLVLTTQNIERITDIITELDRQVGPLGEQAEVAKKYLALKEELKDYEISVYVDSITRITKQLQDISEKYTNVQAEIAQKTQALDGITVVNEEKNAAYKAVDEKLEGIRNQYYENEKQLSEQAANIKVMEGKIQTIEEANQRLYEEMEESQQERTRLSKQKDAYEGDVQRFSQMQEKEAALLKELEEKYAFVMNLMSETSKHVEALRAKLSQTNQQYHEAGSKVAAMEQMISGSSVRKEKITEEIEQLRQESEQINGFKTISKQAQTELQQQIEQLQEQIGQLRSVQTQNEARLAQLRKEATELSSEYQFKSSRLNLLNEMDEKMEGYNRSVKEIISAAGKASFVKGIRGTVAQLIDVEKKYEIAIETALGQAFQYIVTDEEGTAKQAIQYLRENKLGRATFLPMTAVNGKTLEQDVLRRLQKMTGYLGLGYEVIQYDAQYHNVMLSQLGKVAIAQDLDCAIAIAKEFSYNFKIITLQGDIIRPSGAMTGGSIDKAVSSGILGRKREMEELTARTKELARTVKTMNEEAVECTVKISNSSMEAGKLEAERRGLEMKQVEANAAISRFEDRQQQIQQRITVLQEDMEAMEQELLRTVEEMEAVKAEMLTLENTVIALQKEITQCEEKNSTGRATVDAMNAQVTDKKLAVNSILHKIETARENQARLQQEMTALEETEGAKQAEIAENQRIAGEMKEANRQIEAVIQTYLVTKTDQSGEIEKLTLEKQILSDALLSMTDQIAEMSKQLYLLKDESNRFEVRKAKLETEEENFRTRLWDDYEITYGNAQEYLKGKELGSFTSMQRYMNELRGKIRDLGEVNVNAIEDYKNTRERLEFLNGQMEDLNVSKEKLEKIIHDMTVIMKKQFLEQFDLINASFNSVFRELFDGGRANIMITDKDNVLESPIEIEAQPPGKKLQNMMLLSGGEKALTAIALLFAVLKLKPTPFCVLDEIEAALDDTNVIRFADYVTKFSEKTQFIIITHRKGTMENADILYGVTMEERGVSKIVSMKFADDKDKGKKG